MKALAWIGLSLIAIFALYRMTAARAERAETEIATLRQAMAALSVDVARGDDVRPARIVAEVPRPVAAAPASSSRSSGDAPTAPAKARAITYADQLAYYHASLQAEDVDASWSRASSQRLRGMFDQMTSSATALRSVECRHTICRAELTHDTEAESRAFYETWTSSQARLEWQGPVTGGVVSTQPDGSARSVFFFSREGTTLPEIQ